MTRFPLTLAAALAACGAAAADDLAAELTAYRENLAQLRKEYGGTYSLPDEKFFLFGMGGRDKLVYQAGRLWDARTGNAVRTWKVKDELIVPPAYAVRLTTADGAEVTIREDGEGVWVEEGGTRTALSKSPLKLPAFAGHPHAAVLRVLHQEVLVNVIDGKPVPSYFVYKKPWHRDAAMMAMVLEKAGNLALIRDWTLALRDPYDRNNAGIAEPDNLGQVLYLVALAGGDKTHPAAKAVLDELPRVTAGKHLTGKSDFAPHPVYQTKWLKFGLKALALPDDAYEIPPVVDTYSPLVWWVYKDRHAKTAKRHRSADYPYLTWADDHFYGEKTGKVSNRDYPLTWEAKASQADYNGIRPLSPAYADKKLAAPHTWHAAEMFLLLAERK